LAANNLYIATDWFVKSHILVGINMIPINVLVQLIDMFIILVDGSNTENRFVIIFSLAFLFLFHFLNVFLCE
jgi:hypothetical protein